jgi:multidrug efflux pump subunit AcrA (membrane-fusion protein)
MIIVGPIIMVRRWPLSILAIWFFTAWFVPRLYRELLGTRALHQEAQARVAAAEAVLSQVAEQKRHLERELQKLMKALQQAEGELRKERQKPRAAAGVVEPVFRRVGLDPSAPRFVIDAAHKAYRRAFHPDLHPQSRKAESERKFKQAEAAFDEIGKLRGFSKT